jgi:hypothetical protein
MILLVGSKFINTSKALHVGVLDNGPSRTTIFALAGGDHYAQLDVDHATMSKEDQVRRRRYLAADIAKDAGSMDAYEITPGLALRKL